jgi:TP901 family phage tail tape measure protein
MATTLANLRVSLNADSSKFSRKMQRASKRVKSFTKTAAKTSNLLKGFLVAGTAAIAIRKLTTEIGEFEKAISQVKAVTQATQGQMKEIIKTARDLGGITEFSAREAAEGMAFLGRAGFKTEEVIAAIPATLDLATAGMLDMASAADIASNVMSSFGIAAEETTRVTDVLAITAASANTDILQMGEAMAQVGAFSAGLGVSVEDTAAAIGILSNAGIQASAAGSALKAIFAGLLGTSEKTSEILERLGISLSDIDPRTKSIVDIVDTLTRSGLGASEALQLFGRRGVTAILALQKNAGVLRELTMITNNATGASARMADVMRQNLATDVKLLTSALSELILTMGDAGLGSALRSNIQGLAQMARDVTTLTNFFSPLLAIIGSMIIVIKNLVDVIVRSLSGTALAALFLLSGQFKNAMDAMKSAGEGIKQDFGDIAENLVKNFAKIDEAVEARTRNIAANIEKVGELDPGLERSKRLREGLTRDLERVRQSLLNKEELEIQSFNKSQNVLTRALEDRRITMQEFNLLSQQLEMQHQESMFQLKNANLIRDLESLKQNLLSKQMLENEFFIQQQEILRRAFEEGLIPTKQEFQELERQLTMAHQNELTKIEEAESKKRNRINMLALRARAQQTRSLMQGIASTITTINQALFKDSKAAAIANAVISTALAVTRALANPPGPPFSIPQAAAAAAAGAAQIATIASSSIGGGRSVPSISGGFGNAGNVPPAQETFARSNVPEVAINLGDDTQLFFSRERIRELIEFINDQFEDGARIRIA